MRELALGLVVLGYVLLMWTNPARASFGDGWRCVRRYPVIWRTLAWLAFANAVFLLAVRLTAHWRGGPQLIWMRPAWNIPGVWLNGTPESLWWLPPATIREILISSALPALETLAGLFNNVITTFPVAVFAALGLLFNRRRTLVLLSGVIARRFRFSAWLIITAILLCAAAVVLKSILYFQPAWIGEPLARWAPVVAACAALFEYIFGVGVQAYLILYAYAWVRGLSFEPGAMREVAIRRLGAAAKWAGLVLLVQAIFIEAPLALAFTIGWPGPPDTIGPILQTARWCLAGALLVFVSMQAWLTLHGETLRRAWSAHWRLLRRHGIHVFWFLVIAAVHCFFLQGTRALVLAGLGEETGPGLLFTIIWPLVFGLVAGWLLASWVCLFKRLE